MASPRGGQRVISDDALQREKLDESKDIKRRTITGLGWTASSQILLQATQFAFTAALARLLTPYEFGLIALIVVFSGFAAVFVDFGMTAAIIQRPQLEDRHLATAFWLNLGAGIVFTLAMMALAPGLAAFYNEPELVGITLALAPVFVLSAVGMVQMAVLQREMNFRRIALVENLTIVGANAVAIGLAVAGFGVWSLVALTLANVGLRSLLLWLLSPWRPHRFFDRLAAKELWHFSSRIAGFNAVNYWARNADNLLIGKFVGTTQLAFYNRAYNLMLMPVLLVASVTSRVMFPALSRIQENREQVKRVYLRAFGLIALVTCPAIVGLFVVAEPFILTIYGTQWTAVVPILQILCLPALLQSLSRTTGWIFQSQGRADWMFRWGLAYTAIMISSFFIGLPWGVNGIAAAYACATVIGVIPLFWSSGSLIGVTLLDLGKTVVGVFAASIVMGVIVWIVELRIPHGWGSGAELALGVVAGALTYLLVLHVTSPAPYREFRRLVGEAVGRRSALRVASS